VICASPFLRKWASSHITCRTIHAMYFG
jgi:hypothetical protein